MEIFNYLEPAFNLSWLVSIGDFWAAKCGEIGGDWIRLADNSYECVNTNLDDKLNAWLDSLRG